MSDDVYKKIFSRNLRYYMDQAGKSQIDIINDLGINKSSISTWVNGTRLPRMDSVELLARYLGIKRSDLIEDKGELRFVAPSFVCSPSEQLLVEHYRSADLGTKAAVNKLLDIPGEPAADASVG